MATYIKRKSAKQEKRTAREFRGKTTPASGALSGAKGDVRTGVRNGSYTNENDFLIENKYTDKNFYPLKYSIYSFKFAFDHPTIECRLAIYFLGKALLPSQLIKHGILTDFLP